MRFACHNLRNFFFSQGNFHLYSLNHFMEHSHKVTDITYTISQLHPNKAWPVRYITFCHFTAEDTAQDYITKELPWLLHYSIFPLKKCRPISTLFNVIGNII